MRTYTRKRPEYQFIEGVGELCRLCLEKCEENVPIFEKANDICATLAMRIMICVGLEMSQENCLPNMICKECFKELEKYYTFRKKCEVSYHRLKSHLHAAQKRDLAKNLTKKECHIGPNKEEKQCELHIDPSKLMLTFNDDQVDMLDLNGVVVSENANMNEIPELSERIEIEVPGPIESQSEEDHNPDISDFLSTILINLGILAKHDDKLSVLDPDMKTVTLETGDGDQIHLELTEEDDVKETEDEDIVIKYITSNYSHSNGRGTIPNLNKSPSSGSGSGGSGGTLWCSRCGVWFSSAGALARHRRGRHRGAGGQADRPHRCPVCQRAFAQKEVMLRHRLVHDEVRPFTCSLCPKSFTQRGALAAHARAHAPPHARALALHRCLKCPKVFLYASGLSRHMMIHNGRVYACGVCDRQFNDRSSLARHAGTLHLTTHQQTTSTHAEVTSTQLDPTSTHPEVTSTIQPTDGRTPSEIGELDPLSLI